MKIALICPTVGQTQRGYERFIRDLFRELRTDHDVTLFKGAGKPARDEIVVPHLRRTGILDGLTRGRLRYERYCLEFASFALAVLPRLLRGGYDLVHFIDPPLAQWLERGKRGMRRPYMLLFTDAGPVPCDASRWVDHSHCVTPAAHAAALRAGLPERALTMIPVGVNPAQFRCDEDRAALRRRYRIAEDAFVVLAVTTMNRHHKRIDHLISEVARVQGNPLLWIDASLHPDGDPSLLELADERLGDRFRHSHVPSETLGELYRCADVLVSSALEESFGMAMVEAATTGLPVIAHDSSHFRWLLGDAAQLVDMARLGALAEMLTSMMAGRGALRNSSSAERIVDRFGWERLRAEYVEMYRRCLAKSR